MARTQHHAKFRSEDGFLGYVITLFHNKRMLSGVVTICIVLVGILFALRIRREAMPNVALDTYQVFVSYPGASPTQVEKEAIIPIEDTLRGMSGIDSYSSNSSQNSGSVTINIDQDAPDPEAIGDEIFRKMNLGTIKDISSNVKNVSVERRSATQEEIYSFGLLRPDKDIVDDVTFYRIADSLSSEINNLEGVQSVTIAGSREQQVEINVNPRALVRNYVDINSVVNAIRSRNVRSTAGTLEDPKNYKAIVTISEYSDLAELRNTVIRSGFDGNRVLLRDVAKVSLAFPKKTSYNRIDLQEAIVLEVNKRSSADIVKTAKAVKTFLENNIDSFLPEGINWIELIDQGHSVNEVSRILIINGIIGFFLILLILFIFLDFTTAFWTAAGLPVTITLTLAYMGSNELTLNYLTLTAMITMIGMLVDHGIVISETIFMRRSKGFSPLRAAIDGLRSVFWPVVVTVLTTIMAFLPLFLISGISGKFTRFFPIMVTIMLSFSFLEACFLLVTHLLHAKPQNQSPRLVRRRQQNIAKGRLPQDSWFSPIIHVYQRILRIFIRLRWPSLIFFTALLAGGFFYGLPALKNFSMFPDDDDPLVFIRYTAKTGAVLEQTQEIAKQLEQKILDISPEGQIKYIWSDSYTEARGGVKGYIVVYLADKKDQPIPLSEYNKLLSANLLPYGKRSRLRIENLALASNEDSSQSSEKDPYRLSKAELEQTPVLFENVRIGWGGGPGGGGSAISIRLYSDDEKQLSLAGKASIDLLESMAGTQNITSTESEQIEQIRVALNYQQMARFGVQLSQVNNTLRTAFQGSTASTSRSGSKSTDYIVRLEEPYRKSINTILSLTVKAATGQFIPLSRFARLTTELSPPHIRHYKGQRTLRLTGGLDRAVEGITSLKITEDFTKQFTEKIQSQYPDVTLGSSDGEARQSQQFITDIVPAFVIAVLLIFLILILLFDSFLQPLIVMGAIPFGLMGGLVALQLHGLPVSFMAVLGFMGLVGVVVNDSVVMVEFINHIVHRYPRTASKLLEPMVLKGAGRRLRPVILTTLTTVLGLFPTIYGLGGDPGFVRPVVLVLGYGLLMATLITLFFIPAFYMIQLDFTYWLRQYKEKLFHRNSSAKLINNLPSAKELEDNYDLPPDPWV